ncbi:hypothetical protein GCM10017691_50160 [Pseudonocardia petroleophila]
MDRAVPDNLFLRACITRTPKPTDEHHEPYTGRSDPGFGLLIRGLGPDPDIGDDIRLALATIHIRA